MDQLPVPDNNNQKQRLPKQGHNEHRMMPRSDAKRRWIECCVAVKNLPLQYSKDDLTKFAREFGSVKEVTFYEDHAKVEFWNKVAGWKMKKTSRSLFGRRVCAVSWHTHCMPGKKYNEREPPKNPAEPPQPTGHLVPHQPCNTQPKQKKWAKKPQQPELYHNTISQRLNQDVSFEQEVAILAEELLAPDPTHVFLQVYNDLSRILSMLLPKCEIYPFGSTVTGLAFKGSDIDLVVDREDTLNRYNANTADNQAVHERSLEDNWLLTSICCYMEKNMRFYQNIFFVQFAKVPVLKFTYQPFKVYCDLSVKNVSAVQNSNLVKFYMSLDTRVKPLLLVVKYWAKYFKIVKNGSFTNYALTMMVIFYLQQLDEPVLPPVCVLQKSCLKKLYVDSWECSFNANPEILKPTKNESPLPILLSGFFEYCSNFNYSSDIVCPLLGKPVPKFVLQDFERLPPEMNQLMQNGPAMDSQLNCTMFTQDPFLLDYNITRAVQKGTLPVFQNMCKASAYVLSQYPHSGMLKYLLKPRTLDLSRVRWLWDKGYQKVEKQTTSKTSSLPAANNRAPGKSVQQSPADQDGTAPGKSVQHSPANPDGTAPGKSVQHSTADQDGTAPGKSAEHAPANPDNVAPGKSVQHSPADQDGTAPGKSAEHVPSNPMSAAIIADPPSN